VPRISTTGFGDRVRTAHGDAWQVEGRLRERFGGGALELRAIRLMASGLPHPQWNNGDVTGPDADLDGARAFYAERGAPWGVRVPAELDWPHGTWLFRKRLMGVHAADFRRADAVEGLEIRAARPGDLEDLVRISAPAFEEDPDVEGSWIAPHLGADGSTLALATLDGVPVGTGRAVFSDGWAGPCVYVGGVAVVESVRGRGIGAAITSWLSAQGLARGAEIAHLHPDNDAGARLFARLGYVETPGFDVYVDL
jgi:GNAT superfamily N-acetyltransferase